MRNLRRGREIHSSSTVGSEIEGKEPDLVLPRVPCLGYWEGGGERAEGSRRAVRWFMRRCREARCAQCEARR